MTGLTPGVDKIIEIAAIATDMDFHEYARYESAVKIHPNLIRERMQGDFWERNAQTRANLIAANLDGKPIAEVEQDLLKLVKDNFGSYVYLAGNSIHQDRKFIEKEMPELNRKLHYRMLDVSSWKIYFENALNVFYKKPEDHRALSDIEGSIAELKYYLTYMSKTPLSQEDA